MLKTRDRLIEVAHRLFLLKGVENTTMSDIADASDKGRRTLYTYFKSKGDIFDAVIRREGERYISSLEEIRDSSDCSAEKLQRYIDTVFDTLGRMEKHHNSFINWLNNNFRATQKRGIITTLNQRSAIILNSIITEGIKRGEFDPEVARSLVSILPTLVKAVYMNPDKEERFKDELARFILTVIKKKTI
ncbi:MAG: TetR/AcrR family transcriptional regulator [Muribaculaceae bacterium]|nr:TetR/AcrR family transcriptional regulator [Muribaculaceae bacterium]